MYDPDNLESDHERQRDSGAPSLKSSLKSYLESGHGRLHDSGVPSPRSLAFWSLIWFISVILFAVFLFMFVAKEIRAQTPVPTVALLPAPSDRASPYPYGLSVDTQTFRLPNQRGVKPRQSYPAYSWTPELNSRGSLRNTKYR